MNIWWLILWLFDIVSGAFIIACIGYIFELPFWALYGMCIVWGWLVGRDVGKRMNNQKGKK